MALLAIDQGNTRTKFGIFADDTLRYTWSVPTEKSASIDELQAAVRSCPALPAEYAIGLCSVVPEMIPRWQEMAQACHVPITVMRGTSSTPLRNCYASPATLGPDRLMAAVAAAERLGAPVIPVSLGTATVVDAVSANNEYLGGMIAPGIGTAANALAGAASALWPVEWHEPATAIGRTSDQAMVSGLFFHSVGGVQAMVDAVRRELGVPAPLVLTGGWAATIAPYLDGVAAIEDHLILYGIAVSLR